MARHLSLRPLASPDDNALDTGFCLSADQLPDIIAPARDHCDARREALTIS
jgi:hypothetical protein